MYLHNPCGFDPIYTRSRSQSPIGPATTPQNESSCETFYFWRRNVTKYYGRVTEGPEGTVNSAKICHPKHLARPFFFSKANFASADAVRT